MQSFQQAVDTHAQHEPHDLASHSLHTFTSLHLSRTRHISTTRPPCIDTPVATRDLLRATKEFFSFSFSTTRCKNIRHTRTNPVRPRSRHHNIIHRVLHKRPERHRYYSARAVRSCEQAAVSCPAYRGREARRCGQDFEWRGARRRSRCRR